MTRDQHNTGATAVGYFWLGVLLEMQSGWLILTNILLSSYGMVAALTGSAVVMWDGIFPVLVSTGPQTLSTSAGFMLGVLVSVVEILVWRKALEWENMGLMSRSTIWAIVVYDITSTVWGLTSGQFYDPANSTASVMRVAMSLALTIFAFSVGAERWWVLGFTLISQNWKEAFYTMHWQPRPKKDKGQPDNRNEPRPASSMQEIGLSPEQIQRIREEQSRRDKERDRQKREAEFRNQKIRGGAHG